MHYWKITYVLGKAKKHAMRSSLGKEIRDEVKCIQWDPLSMDYFLVSRQISGKPFVYL